jgi:hypothetical protein
MDKQKQIQQLRLTADLLETGGAFEILIEDKWVASTTPGLAILCPFFALFQGFEIRASPDSK